MGLYMCGAVADKSPDVCTSTIPGRYERLCTRSSWHIEINSHRVSSHRSTNTYSNRPIASNTPCTLIITSLLARDATRGGSGGVRGNVPARDGGFGNVPARGGVLGNTKLKFILEALEYCRLETLVKLVSEGFFGDVLFTLTDLYAFANDIFQLPICAYDVLPPLIKLP